MPRPVTKADLIESSDKQFKTMWELIDSIPKENLNAPLYFGDTSSKKEAHWKRDKNLRDVLIHLYEWHQLLINWILSNQSGDARPFLSEPYNWRTYPQMNVEFWEKHQQTTFEQARKLLKESHCKVMQTIETFTDDELFSKGLFPWTGNSTLGSYCVSSTSSHYVWAIKKIKANKKV